MEITIDWHTDQFNVNLHTAPGADPFLTIKGCRLANGKNGQFVSYPATKNEKTGKWWQHVYGGEKFNAAVLDKAQKANTNKKPSGSGFDDMTDVPF